VPKSDKVYIFISFALIMICALLLYVGITGYLNIVGYEEGSSDVSISVYLAVSSICFALSALFSVVSLIMTSLCLGTNNKVIKGALIAFMVLCGIICVFSAVMLKRL